jgi:hypothetical protein
MKKTGRFLTTVGEAHPVILCERHAQVFEIAMVANAVPHTIYEFDDADPSEYCQACDLQVAKEYALRQEQNKPRIVLPGDLH